MSPTREKLQIAVALVLVLIGGMLTSSVANAQGPEDFALRHPLFAAAARLRGKDWEADVHPRVRILLDLQRLIKDHALIVGFSDELPNPRYTSPNVVIVVTRWDGTDLYTVGIPRQYPNGKPVKIVFMKDFPHVINKIEQLDLVPRIVDQLAAPLTVYECTYERPAKGWIENTQQAPAV